MKIKKHIKNLILIIILCIVLPLKVYAKPGCCSWHGGEAGCSGGYTICSDGHVSSCRCDGTVNGNYGGSQNNTRDESAEAWGIVIFFGSIIVIGILIMYISYKIDNWKLDRDIERKEREAKERQQKSIERQIEFERNRIDFKKAIVDNCESYNELEEILNTISCEYLLDISVQEMIELIIELRNISSKNLNLLMSKIIDCHFDNRNRYNCTVFFEELIEKLIILESYNKKIDDICKIIIRKKCIECHLPNNLDEKYYLNGTQNNNYGSLLSLAVKYERFELAKYLLENSANCVFWLTYYNIIDIFEKIYNNQKELLDAIINSRKIKYVYTLNTFEYVFNRKNVSLFENFVEVFNEKIYDNKLILQELRIISKNIEFNCINIFLSKYQNINDFFDKYGIDLVFMSIENKNIDIIDYMISKKFDFNIRREDGITPLIFAILKSDMDLVEKIVSSGAQVNLTDSNNNTPLEYACELKKMRIVKYLRKNGGYIKGIIDNLIDNAIKLNNKERLPKIYIKYLANIEREKQEKKQHTNTRKKSAYRNYKKY